MSVDAASGLEAIEVRGAKRAPACASWWQQNVSRFHNLQLRFSSLLPSSSAREAFEKSDHCEASVRSGAFNGAVYATRRSGLTMPKRFSTLLVSMVCNAGTSTRNIECCGLKGMLAVLWLVCSEQRGVVGVCREAIPRRAVLCRSQAIARYVSGIVDEASLLRISGC